MENTRTKTPQFYILVNLHLSPTLSNHLTTHEKIISGLKRKKHERTPTITKRTFIVYEVREPMIRFFQLFYSENGKNIFPT